MQKFGYISPLVTIDFVRIEYDALLIIIDRWLFDAWIQMVMPSLSTLLTSATTNMVLVCQLLSDKCPPFGSVFRHQVNYGVILLLNKKKSNEYKFQKLFVCLSGKVNMRKK